MRLALDVHGIVQGVGFRPFVYREATERGLVGWVRNRPDRVEVEVQGSSEALDGFVSCLRIARTPVRVDEVVVREVPERSDAAFAILPSGPSRPAVPTVAADLTTCPECARETLAGRGRRHGYAFTNCSRCGPRYSIVRGVPYDRSRTSMSAFVPCTDCAREYEDVSDRRFHAEPIACPICGPRLQLLDRAGAPLTSERGPLDEAIERLRRGEIVAVKGLGGFQLLCDATDGEVVARLRERKRRSAKPFAVLFADVASVRRNARVGAAEEAALTGPEGPIVLLRRCDAAVLSPATAPDNSDVGALLPTSPLHHLLARGLERPLVCTSGNLSEEPMCIETAEALDRLGGIADAFLTHDRPIVRPVDDSVVRVDRKRPRVLRRARGFAPLEVARIDCPRTILAVGAHQKSAVAIAHEGRVFVSQHLGDLVSPAARDLLDRTVTDLLDYLGARPDVVACDRHPDYASTHLAEAYAAERGVPLMRVQHHEAHVAAVLAEHGVRGDALGLAWDGTGLGLDGTAWGGEALVGSARGFERVAHLRRFRLLGADRAAREPRRAALGVLAEALGDRAAAIARGGFSESELGAALDALSRGVSAPWTTAAGRLFDAVAALLGWWEPVSFEAQAAMWLEHLAERAELDAVEPYPLPVLEGRRDVPAVCDWAPTVAAIAADIDAGTSKGACAARFHAALAHAALAVAQMAGEKTVVLSGGCFQNRVLSELVRRGLEHQGYTVLEPESLPPNDGAIAFGQVFVAAARC